MDKYTDLYLAKIIAGTLLGVVLGLLKIDPITIIEKIIYIGLILVVLFFLTLLLRMALGINESLKKLLLLHGTFWYIVTILGFWALIINTF